MLKFAASMEPLEYQVENTAMKQGFSGHPWLGLMSLMQSQTKTRELLASNLANTGECVNELFKTVIFQQMQNSDMPTHYSTNTPRMHSIENQRVLPALDYYPIAGSPRKRFYRSEDAEDADSPHKRVRWDDPGQNPSEHLRCANYNTAGEDVGYQYGAVRGSQHYEGNHEAGSHHGVWYDRYGTTDRGGANEADGYDTRTKYKADRPDSSYWNYGGRRGTQARSRDGSNHWRSTDARANKDSSHRGGTHAYRHTSSERRTEVYIDRREWVRNRNTKDPYGGDDRSKRHGGTKGHEHFKNSNVHESHNGDNMCSDNSMSYDSDGSTKKKDRWHKGFAPPSPPLALTVRQAFSPCQPHSNRQSERQRDADWLPRAYWHALGKKTQEMVRKHGKSERQKRRRGREQLRRREAAVTDAAAEDVNDADMSIGSTSGSAHRRRNDNRERGDVDRSEVEHRPPSGDHDDLECSNQYDEVDYGGEE